MIGKAFPFIGQFDPAVFQPDHRIT